MSITFEAGLGIIGGLLGIVGFIYGIFRDKGGDTEKHEHRLTSLEERSLSREDVAAFHQMKTQLANIDEKVTELCKDYKETNRFIFTELPKSLKKTTAPKFDMLMDQLSASVDPLTGLPTLPREEAAKAYKLLKAEFTRASKKEDMGRMVVTKIVIERMSRHYGFDGGEPISKVCAV